MEKFFGSTAVIENSNNISMVLLHLNDDDDDVFKIAVDRDDWGTPYVPAERLMDVLKTLAKTMTETPLEGLYVANNYNY